jgi:hypothetical protein
MLIDKLFLKKRWVLIATANLYPQKLDEHYSFCIYEDVHDIDIKKKTQLKTIVSKRLSQNNWVLFAILDKKNRKIVAYYWAAFCTDSVFWHDNFVIFPGTSLLCNAYVERKHRSKGLYKYLIYRTHEYLFKNNIKKTFTIVENSNNNSLKINCSSGLSVYCVNYLIKMFGINLFSVFIRSSKITLVLFGSRLLKRIVYRNRKFLWKILP